jgi:hypothetical protein
MDPLLIVLSCRSFYIGLMYWNTCLKLAKIIYSYCYFSKNYPIICMGVLWVEWSRGNGVYIYKMCFWTSVLYADMGVTQVFAVGANGRMCFFWVKWGILIFLSFSVNVDVMWVHAVGANSLVLSCFLVVCLKKWIYCEHVVVLYAFIVVLCVCTYALGHVLICCSILVIFRVLEVCLWCCFLVFWEWILCDVNVL